MTTSLTQYQKKILKRLVDGEILWRTNIGIPQSFHFENGRNGINTTSIQNLKSDKLIEITTKNTMYGRTEYAHLPGTKPWIKHEAYIMLMRR